VGLGALFCVSCFLSEKRRNQTRPYLHENHL
jgi:hypothetical protein